MALLTDLSLRQALEGLSAKTFSSEELTRAHIEAIEAARPLNAYILETPEKALEMARASDARRAAGDPGALEGAPLGIKDLFCTDGVRTTAGSRILGSFTPTYESTVTTQLWRDGAVMLGKLNLDEFAMGSSSETSAFGPVVSPWRRRDDTAPLTPGGSSGGSAAAVAAGLCLGATATDTGGSIRQPAAFTGTVGIKPTYGRCSRWGVVAFASSLDQAGPIARTVEDAALLLKSMSGHDPKDSTSLNVEVPDFPSFVGRSVKGMRIGVPKEYRVDGMPAEIEALWEQGIGWLRDAGCEIVEVSLPHTRYALPAYYIVAPAEASSNLARYDGMRYGLRAEASSLTDTYEKSRAEGFGEEVKRRILIGAYVLSAGYYDAYYLRALKVRRRIADDFTEAFGKVDALLTPTAPSAAFALGENADDPVAMYLNDIFTVTVNLAGLPGMSVPAGLDAKGLPLGLQLIGRPLDEGLLFSLGGAIEKAAGFSLKPARWW
ncbi:MAG: Asp-tRNA(Asn)/Glu-tRNA(Gln) amidotransferase subunit GatA [Phenylobacterium sp.]|uniref:Asp-tRNA(Asn)/Glu-tRNA(Gln) amidotransferase subunit GatA n=2 Tax=Phenylobacterium sp. TaxID=1871053 RepID=UPI0025F74769|nr:Asp-tRNA(Asn)/Glu-tRNA(Gln) amidotransferase subunit GatA [Phenylobacterium sp.]MCA6224303.1 Asp-tRNA(Asn)/Glu-tRNA(Gln) amidotransferase subunit GatA [Phenylobacterium sp.]MCA6232161.1 Asp-tRNA(Asn)/Glu-tRNA(Gln) amidotransferase subunit GatA [Phenylobacterium sp.]MCA6235227.1 Asp-tRNA(Asn)/Glu-tRNA(Gln) amidotransferase subunit GatA [Phenylobacterium sp.]MCA6250419.1 Asp-tRNA(Asn)/Glu-tRNA(Gln) amidotransferase subunit GatA [Phenylobacterium sp.]MCA6253372.1 Asp-tRNA(Asn)/Glu-tRNA(Gln) am